MNIIYQLFKFKYSKLKDINQIDLIRYEVELRVTNNEDLPVVILDCDGNDFILKLIAYTLIEDLNKESMAKIRNEWYDIFFYYFGCSIDDSNVILDNIADKIGTRLFGKLNDMLSKLEKILIENKAKLFLFTGSKIYSNLS